MPRHAEIPPALTTRPFQRVEGLRAGLSRYVLEGPRFTRVHPSVYVVAGRDLGFEERVDAALLALPDSAVVSHDTATRLLGLPLPRGHRDDRVHVWVPDTYTGRELDGVVLHRYLKPPDATVVGGRRATSPGKTFVDMATRCRLPDLVAIGDAVVRRCGYLPLDLCRLARERRRRWIRLARQAARLVRAHVDSAPETHLRLAILDDLLPEPDTGRDVLDPDGGWLARPDLSWARWKVAVEYDGAHHHKDPAQRRRDIRRVENLHLHGWQVVVVTDEDLYRRREATMGRIRTALRAQGAPVF